jgi:hypothetical protein
MTEAEEFHEAWLKWREREDSLPPEEQKRRAFESLISMGVFTPDGEFTDAYAGSREYYRRLAEQRAAA